jgi:hypothetical protein
MKGMTQEGSAIIQVRLDPGPGEREIQISCQTFWHGLSPAFK